MINCILWVSRKYPLMMKWNTLRANNGSIRAFFRTDDFIEFQIVRWRTTLLNASTDLSQRLKSSAYEPSHPPYQLVMWIARICQKPFIILICKWRERLQRWECTSPCPNIEPDWVICLVTKEKMPVWMLAKGQKCPPCGFLSYDFVMIAIIVGSIDLGAFLMRNSHILVDYLRAKTRIGYTWQIIHVAECCSGKDTLHDRWSRMIDIRIDST